ncbi:MAG TPA: cation transporter [Algoriphagus sp.]|jgi:Cu(I)/Ag(I) efflux system membrane protein CusA/SilA|uniref:efflux RND transporter permease subunit n=3 Tax=Algoriphagus TaxID=246875 RepID=UPI000C4D2725|nr:MULTISPECIES: efflux RND transporter permease subunit [unclassified Algoriphagus]MAL14714.1 cation transporter [Algoriphagus sp.]HCD87137.1 cation transporter [Algoriphagus sp.]|tara:strand:+ start:2358 stop:6191 length:3834 start_codon:yes stop_codon:yes gene_type:complete
MLNSIIKYFPENKLVTVLLLLLIIAWGVATAPFNWNIGILPRDPVPVDAIPDIGENQQIVFTEWMGRSPQDVEDQITYPLTTSLLGLPGVKSVRSSSALGFSSIYIIFEEDIEFYWSRSRVLEKLNSLPAGLLPEGVQPKLGPDATALGQVYWYTLEGRDPEGNPVGGWDLHELRTIQDYYVRYALTSVAGVSEVASVGGYIKEYQVDVDPAALKANGVSLMDVMEAMRKSNLDVSANTIEVNRVDYFIRGLGYVEELSDLDQAVVKVTNNVPIRIQDVARVNIGPQPRNMGGILDKSGAEAVGGVVIARYGDNPLEVIEGVKAEIEKLSEGLPSKTLADGTVSKVTLVPFYDRTGLIYETLGTLYEAISLQILITIIVIIVMVYNLRASLLISALLPLAVLMCFIFMKYFGVDANIVALSGIAIAIGTMVDLGIILNENILRHLEQAPEGKSKLKIVYEATAEVSGAILTAVSTTIISFLPVFTLQAAEGKLFGPLAYTKSFALVAALIFTLLIMPAFSHWFFSFKGYKGKLSRYFNYALVLLGLVIAWTVWAWGGWVLVGYGLVHTLAFHFPEKIEPRKKFLIIAVTLVAVTGLLTTEWMPLGVSNSTFVNFLFIGLLLLLVLGGFSLFIKAYPSLLTWCLNNKKTFLIFPALVITTAASIWLGFNTVFGFIPKTFDQIGWNIRTSSVWSGLSHTFPGLGEEFMPSLNEGSFLLMPTTMPHSGVQENKEVLQKLDMLVTAIPEVELVVGKAGRAETAIDPAPISMFENTINYKSEYATDINGNRIRYKVNKDGHYELKNGLFHDPENSEPHLINTSQLIPDSDGEYFRQWRKEIKSPDDIWDEIVGVINIPGVTSSPKLQPIETRLVMLQTGMRVPMGIKVYGPDLQAIEEFGLKLENYLKEVPSVKSEAVFADRIVGKPYLELDINREQISRYGMNVVDVQDFIETAIGGMKLSTTVEGRERFPIRVRYAREFRDDPDAIANLQVPTPMGNYIPLGQLVDITYRPGPDMIRGENSFLVGYVLLDKKPGFAEVSVVEDAQRYLKSKIDSGELVVPSGVRYQFSGSYENQIRAEKRLSIVVPLSLIIIFLILYFQFRAVSTTLFVFTGIAMAFSGGFWMIWLYGQDWFMDFSLLGTNMRELFQMKVYNLSVAVWVGFIALFGIATDDGVVVASYLDQSFKSNTPKSAQEVREAVLEAGKRRVLPCLMTTATTLLALVPVFTSTGRGSDIMIPMAIPSLGGMVLELTTVFIVPTLYCWWAERKLKNNPTVFAEDENQ